MAFNSRTISIGVPDPLTLNRGGEKVTIGDKDIFTEDGYARKDLFHGKWLSLLTDTCYWASAIRESDSSILGLRIYISHLGTSVQFRVRAIDDKTGETASGVTYLSITEVTPDYGNIIMCRIRNMVHKLYDIIDERNKSKHINKHACMFDEQNNEI